MLEAFIGTNRAKIIAQASARVVSRIPSSADAAELTNGIPIFLDHLIEALIVAASSDHVDHGKLAASAWQHGRDLLARGMTIAQVVHDYGDVCQVVTELAMLEAVPIPALEFRTLNLCLDDAIAEAVTAYSYLREQEIEQQSSERSGVLAEKLLNLLNSAVLAHELIKRGQVAPGGSTGIMLGGTLVSLRELIVRSLSSI